MMSLTPSNTTQVAARFFRNFGVWMLVVLSVVGSSYAQEYERVDASIQLYPTEFDTPEQLSRFITRDFTSEEDKVRAIYTWIIENVRYDPDEYKQFNYSFKNYRERNQKEEKTREKIIKRTLQKGVAVCEGYAMLFERLCELQGIQNYLVRGDTKTHFKDIGRKYNSNHMWNVAIIDGKPYLFDPTWGAGRFNGTFIKDPSYYFYKTPPEHFFKTHYPDIFEDAFVDHPVSREEFSRRPLIIEKSLLLTNLETPAEGLLRSDAYFGEIPFRITNISPERISYSYGDEVILINEFTTDANAVEFTIPIEMGRSNLLIYFDDKPALGYKIK